VLKVSPERAILAPKYPSVMSFVDELNGSLKLNSHKPKTKDGIAPFAYLTQSNFQFDIST